MFYTNVEVALLQMLSACVRVFNGVLTRDHIYGYLGFWDGFTLSLHLSTKPSML